MTLRNWLGIVAAFAAAGAIAWFGWDVLDMIGGRGRDRNAITGIAHVALIILVSIQVGARIGWHTWAGDYTFPAQRWLIAIGVAAVVFVLSVVSY